MGIQAKNGRKNHITSLSKCYNKAKINKRTRTRKRTHAHKFMIIKLKIVKCSLQNAVFLHFISKKFGQFKKKLYLCNVN